MELLVAHLLFVAVVGMVVVVGMLVVAFLDMCWGKLLISGLAGRNGSMFLYHPLKAMSLVCMGRLFVLPSFLHRGRMGISLLDGLRCG